MQEENKEFKYLSPKKIAQMAECDPKLIRPYFEEYYLKRITYMDQGEERPLIRLMRKGEKFALLLKNTPSSLRAFYEKCVQKSAYFILPMKQIGMLSANDMRSKWGRTHQLYRDLIEAAYQDNAFFEENGIQKPLIIMVKNPYRPVLVLQNGDQAIKRFVAYAKEKKEIINLKTLPQKKDKMLTCQNLHYRFGIDYNMIENAFQKYYEEQQTFEAEGKTYPLIQKVKSEKVILLTLHEHPNALKYFKTLFERDNDILLGKRSLTSQEIPTIKKSSHSLENEG
ncbi:MAG: hypothetical protein IJY92_00350 [Alphaproteobacteria bacterium]|nr:hypothetical protein [Alphaproteobacteria bacterium]